MRTRLRSLSALALGFAALALGTGCNARSSARLSAIEVTFTQGDSSTRTETTFDYDDSGRLTEARTLSGSNVVNRVEIDWDDAQIDDLLITQGSESYQLRATYDDGRLDELDGQQGSFAREITFRYNGDDPTLLSSVTSTFNNDDGSVAQRSTSTYDYDQNRRTEEVSTNSLTVVPIFGNIETSDTVELEWDNDTGTLEEVTEIDDDGNARRYRFSYADGRLDEVEQPNGTAYRLSYDDQNRLSRVTLNDDGDETVWDYEYEDGVATGVTFTPEVPYGTYFDLGGRAHAIVDVMTTGVLFGF